MVDVLLTHSNHLYYDRKQVRKMQPYPPLQTLLAAACLRREGYEVALFDPGACPPGGGLRAGAGTPSAATGCGVRRQFQFPHQDVSAAQSRIGRLDGRAARSAGVPAIVNGSDASDRAAEYLGAGFCLRAGRRTGGWHRRSSAADSVGRDCAWPRTSRHRVFRSAVRRNPASHRAARRSRIWTACRRRHGI